MKCGIKEVSELTGVSARTLRYYDQIGLLKPSKTSEAGYRYYGERELEILQADSVLQGTGNGTKADQEDHLSERL